ncbi:complement factor H-related protein 4 isoform X1 [Carassius gibelio]|uniref:complement factor H-related protein 4 isoform X1 n=1 Tax=Carassius gibelio TaxID=101364 RepID=UPI0022785FFB|nr:complement factor H-related protein 4 isoform X1 [Carassius gibelio]
MESSPAFLCLWMCFIVYASTSNGCSEIPVVENAVVSESSKKTQYSEDDILEYNCDHGYISQRKITYKCTNNEWKIVRDVKCSLKPCESPQDIPNGHYVVEKGKPFVFGTTIKYICNDGYQIMSRFDTRTCREGGWDNQLPECEEVSCQPIVPEGNVRVAGLPDHSDDFIRSGHRLTFSCEGNGLIIRGEKVITCQSNGEWSSPLPKCVEATCLLQSNRTVGDLRIQRLPDFAGPVKPGHKLTFACTGEGMTLNGEKIITCLPNGEWSSPFPICQEIACEGEQLINVGILYGHPSIVSPYRPGHVLLFHCTDVNLKLYGHRAIECQSDGQWDQPYPTCRDSCEVPRDQHLSTPSDYFRGDMKFGTRKHYRCESGYRETAAEATCTQDGWTPDPLCAEATCLLQLNRTVGDLRIEGLPVIEGPVKPGHKLTFSCTGEGMKLNGERDITCLSNGEWSSPFPKCQEIACEGEQLLNVEILFGHPSFVSPYKPGHVLLFRCTDENLKLFGRRAIECQSDGKWDYPYPTCREITCEVPRDQHVYRPFDDFRGDMKLGERKSYRCESGYRQTAAEATCTRDGWTPDPLCAEITCEVPRDQHVYRPSDFFRGDMKLDTKKSYRCESGYSKTAEKATCTRDGWKPDPLCAEITCVLQSTTSGVKQIIPEGKTHFRAGESVEIICSEKGGSSSSKENRKTFRCQENGEWDHKPGCGEIRCEVPRDQNVYLPYDYFRGDLKLGTRRSYYCESGYRQMAAEATCTQDGWTPKPLCAAVPGKCGPPPPVNDGDTADITKKEYNTGERVEYICFNKYKLDTRPPFSNFLTCQQGEWRGKVKCLKPCTVTVEIMNERGIELAYADQQKMFAPHDGHLTYKCQWGKRSVGGGFRKKCNDGEMTLPECV